MKKEINDYVKDLIPNAIGDIGNLVSMGSSYKMAKLAVTNNVMRLVRSKFKHRLDLSNEYEVEKKIDELIGG